MLASAEPKWEYLDDALNISLSIGGEVAGRSIVKSALCLAAANGIDPARCTDAHSYLKENTAEAPFGFYYARDLVRSRPPQVPLHCVAVSNRHSDGQLLGYVEFFGFHRMIVCLSCAYLGPELHTSYAVNPMTGEELQLDFDLSLSRTEVSACFAYECIPAGSYESLLKELMPVIQKRSFDLERERAMERAVRYAFMACGVPEGGDLAPEQYAEFSRLVADQLTPFFARHLRRPR